MSIRSWSRLLPALAVAALFALVAATPKPPAAPQMPVYVPRPCNQYSQSSVGASTALMSGGDGIAQPFSEAPVMVACSLHVSGTGWTYANFAVREWDPLTLAPEPSTIAIRTSYLDPSRLNYYSTNTVPWIVFSPPIVTASVAGVAEPPHTTTSMEVVSTGSLYNYSLSAHYEPAGNPSLGVAQSIVGGGSHEPLQGSHPVLGHAVCSGGEELQELRIVQSVKRTDTQLATRPYELAQRFRVPEPVQLGWVELAVFRGGDGVAQVGEEMPVGAAATLAIAEESNPNAPPPIQPVPLVEALFESPYMFWGYAPPPRWASHVPFDQAITLYPGHDYWIYLRDANSYTFFGRALTGTESPAFTNGVGELHERVVGGEWTPVSGTVLSFKIVGLPTAPVGTSPPRSQVAAFRLSVAPNPANGPLRVEWSGAVGPVKLEVFDARGRRVGRGEGGAAGAWSLSTSGRDARPLPAGVYFVHARDSAGELMVERAVIVR